MRVNHDKLYEFLDILDERLAFWNNELRVAKAANIDYAHIKATRTECEAVRWLYMQTLGIGHITEETRAALDAGSTSITFQAGDDIDYVLRQDFKRHGGAKNITVRDEGD